MHHTDELAYMAFFVFAFSRPLLSTLPAVFTSHMFGFATFGKVYGFLFTVAGVANYSVAALKVLAVAHGFNTANAVVVAVLFTALVLPCMLVWRDKRKRLSNTLVSPNPRVSK